MIQLKNRKIPVIIIQGPTAVGKSSFALKLAEELNSPIISADSRQVYKLMNIGTAKPTEDEQTKIKHHLIDIVNPDEEYNAGTFSENAKQIINDLVNQGKVPIICGGTGFYIKALLEGLFKAPEIPAEIRQNLRNSAETKTPEYFYRKLKKIDPTSAQRINDNDLNRILRALEIYETTGKTITQLWKEEASNNIGFKTVNIMITDERKELYERINKRVDTMVANGLLNEMEDIISKGFKRTDPGLNTVGYKEFYPFLDGENSLTDCIAKIKQNTRNFAKRQFTWYRKIEFDLTLDRDSIIFSNIFRDIMQRVVEK